MKNENKQRGDAGRNTQNTRNTQSDKPAQTPVNQEQPGKNEKESYGREVPGKESDARDKGKSSDETRQPVKGEGRADQKRDSEREPLDERHQETRPATAPEKTRETPKGNQPKA